MTTYVFIWLLLALTLSLLLMQMRHQRKITEQITAGMLYSQKILNSSTDGIVITDAVGKITRFNMAAEEIFGYKEKHVIGKTFAPLLLEDSLKEKHRHLMTSMDKTRKKEAHRKLELQAHRSDGSEFPMTLRISPTAEQGETGYVGMVRDISIRKKAESEKQKTSQIMNFLLHSGPTVFYICDVGKGSLITFVSPNVREVFGYAPESIATARAFWLRFVHTDDQEAVRTGHAEALEHGNTDIEYRLKMADGSYRWVADHQTLMKDDTGKPVALVGRWSDIRKRKKAEQRLTHEREQLDIGLKCANLTTWEWKIDEGGIDWFGDVEGIMGAGRQELNDFDKFALKTHPNDKEEFKAAIQSCLVTNNGISHECRILWPDNGIHWIRIKGELLCDEEGNPYRMAGVITDISEDKKLQVAPASALMQVS